MAIKRRSVTAPPKKDSASSRQTTAGGGTRKPTGPSRLRESARKQTTAIARGTTAKPKGKGPSAGNSGPSKKSSPTPKSASKRGGKLAAIRDTLKSKVKKIASRVRKSPGKASPEASMRAKKSAPSTRSTPSPPQARRIVRKSDVTDAELSEFGPSQTSSRGPFDKHRSDDRRDQEITAALGEPRFKDEDEYTNRSGDKRIGTHNREYE